MKIILKYKWFKIISYLCSISSLRQLNKMIKYQNYLIQINFSVSVALNIKEKNKNYKKQYLVPKILIF